MRYQKWVKRVSVMLLAVAAVFSNLSIPVLAEEVIAVEEEVTGYLSRTSFEDFRVGELLHRITIPIKKWQQ